jgi:hypothetical protein
MQHPNHLPGRAGIARHFRDAAIGCDLARRYVLDDFDHPFCKGFFPHCPKYLFEKKTKNF